MGKYTDMLQRLQILSDALTDYRNKIGVTAFRLKVNPPSKLEGILSQLGEDLDDANYPTTGTHFLEVKSKGKNNDRS